MQQLPLAVLDVALVAAPAVVAAASLNHLLYIMNRDRGLRVPGIQRFSELLEIGLTSVVNFFALVWLTRGVLAILTGGFSPELREISQVVTIPAAISLLVLLSFAALPRILRTDRRPHLM